MSQGAFIAVDWGTTNRRSYRIEKGAVADTHRDDRGVLAMAGCDWAAEAAAIRKCHGDLPMLIAGMAGSNRGWREAPYVDCPATIDDLARSALWIEPGRTAILPGLAQRSNDRPDVMRGEEVQLFGAIAAGLAPADALLCQPGTHCKWAEAKGGAITGFSTAMTGELFALLKSHSILTTQLGGAVADDAAFRSGVKRAQRGDLLTVLFGVRAASVLSTRDDRDAASHTSGLLIGTDVAARRVPGRTVHILADPVLGALYSAAIAENGGTPILIDSHAAFVAGIARLAEDLW